MDDLPERIARLEESLAFSEHEKDQLSAALREAHERIGRLAIRLELLERRLGAMESPPEPDGGAGSP